MQLNCHNQETTFGEFLSLCRRCFQRINAPITGWYIYIYIYLVLDIFQSGHFYNSCGRAYLSKIGLLVPWIFMTSHSRRVCLHRSFHGNQQVTRVFSVVCEYTVDLRSQRKFTRTMPTTKTIILLVTYAAKRYIVFSLFQRKSNFPFSAKAAVWCYKIC